MVDFAIHPDALSGLGAADELRLADEHVVVIELNCFYEATGMGLFDYHKDKQALSYPPCEVRVCEAPVPHVGVKLENAWRDVLYNNEPDGSRVRITDAARAALDERFDAK